MQRQHSSQAHSTLGNTPNLNIGSYIKGNPYIGSKTGISTAALATATSKVAYDSIECLQKYGTGFNISLHVQISAFVLKYVLI